MIFFGKVIVASHGGALNSENSNATVTGKSLILFDSNVAAIDGMGQPYIYCLMFISCLLEIVTLLLETK